MAITVLAVQVILRTGLNEPVFSAANTDGHDFANSGRTFFYAKNGSGGDIECTFDTPGQVDNLDIEPLVVDVAAGEDEIIGPFPPAVYNQDPGTDDVVQVTFEAVGSLTVGAFLLPAT